MSPDDPGSLEGALRAIVDHDECFGFANCVATAQLVFHLDAEGKSVAADVDSDPDLLAAAVDGCPRSAITLIRVRPAGGTRPR